MGKIEAAELLLPHDQDPQPGASGTGALLLGILFLALALPWFALRLLVVALWRDIARIGRFARLAGSSYAAGMTGK